MSTTDATQHPPPSQSYYSPPVTIVLTILLLIFLFIGFFSIYFCRCFMQNLLYSWYNRHSPSGTPVGPASTGGDVGLDPLTIQSFPTFTYSSIKEFRKEKNGLECAICLGEFEDNSILRLLTSCNHVFHQECIDLWLESHKSCPVCRRSLDMPEKSPDNILELHSNEPLEDHAISITIKDEHEDEKGKEGEKVVCSTSQNAEDEKAGEKFSRSKTTGHSIVTSREGEDKFTLRLPEHVRAKLIRGHNATKSCTEFGEFESERTTGNGGFAEVSGMCRGDDSKV